MNKNLENICRICLNRGSRNIFEKSSASESQFTIPQINDNVSSLDRLPEKLRYVTMLKVDSCDGLPKNMCDSCIIQLNVAYNLKKNAIQSDLKLRQYMIEYGMSVTSYTTCSINTVSVIHPAPMIMSATNESPTIENGSTMAAKTTPSPTSVTEQRPFPVMPVIIKEEPIDYEVMSDITVETESFDDHQTQTNHRTINSSISKENQKQNSSTPLPSNSMVAVNTKSLLISTRETSDNEYISAYMSTSSSNSSSQQWTPTTSSIRSTNDEQTKKTISETITDQTKTDGKSLKKTTTALPKQTTTTTTTKQRSHTVKTVTNSREKEIKQIVSDRLTRQERNNELESNRRESRTRGGSLPKKDYKSFYKMTGNGSTTEITPQKNNKRTNNVASKARRMSGRVSRTKNDSLRSVKKQKKFTMKRSSI